MEENLVLTQPLKTIHGQLNLMVLEILYILTFEC